MTPGHRQGPDAGIIRAGRIVWRFRWLILAVWLVGVAVTVGYTVTRPRIFESTTTLFVPREAPTSHLLGGLAASGLLQQAAGITVPSLTPNRDLLVSVLKSRTVMRAVVDRFGLQERYKARYVEDAIRTLQDVATVTASKEGVIAVKVGDTDPQMAASIANFFVEQLDRLVAKYKVGEAGRQRTFLTEQLARAKAELELSEAALRRFQERNRAIVLQDQTRGAIEAAARLKGEIIAAQVQLQVLRNFATDANPDMIALQRRLEEMNRQLGQMQYGDGTSRAGSRGSGDFSVPFARVPEVGLELARLTRDVKVQETLVTLLSQQAEQARISEAKDLPSVQILDSAIPAERHSRPRLGQTTAIAAVVSLLVAVFLAFIVDYVRSLASEVRPS